MSNDPPRSGAPIGPMSGAGSHYVNSHVAGWREDKPGIWVKPLYEDADRGERTLLVRMDPGARSEPHSHEGFEQVYVLSGSFQDDNRLLREGDHCCRTPGVMHSAFSEEGVLVLAIYTRA